MRHLLKTATILSGLTLTIGTTAALAGDCRYNGAPNCQPQVVTHPGGTPSVDPMHVYSQAPMGHLRSVQFLGTPSVNITRVHGAGPSASLSDAPSAFTGGCTPESTHYCRQGAQQAMPAPMPMPMVAAPAPVIAAPVAQPTERIVAIGGGYDPSKFIPRTYGSNELTPGIAHIPTSIVDRSHANATAVLNSGRTQPQPIASGGIVPHAGMINSGVSYRQAPIAAPAPMVGHMGAPMGGTYMGSVTRSMQMAPDTNVYPGSMAGDGTYWEKVSGPTRVDGLPATQILCKRQAPRVNVQSPVIGVPTPVPTPIMTQNCIQQPMPQPMPQPMMHGRAPMPMAGYGSSRYGH